jgi:type II secretory pathway pseudopilin PulG
MKTAIRRTGGFTIIEVIVVIGIAGLILLVVFLAVPSLNRSGRNNERRSDAKYIASQRLQYNVDIRTTIATGSFDCSLPHTSKKFCEYLVTGLAFYDLDDVTFRNAGTTAPTSVPTITDANKIVTDTYLECNENGTAAVVAPTAKSAVVLYAVETRSGIQQQCIETSLLPIQ